MNMMKLNKQINILYLTFVAIDEAGKPKKVPPFPTAKTPEEKASYQAALKRMNRRLEWRKSIGDL